MRKLDVALFLVSVLVSGLAACGPADDVTGVTSGLVQSPPLQKFKDPLPIPSVMQPTVPGGTHYEVELRQVKQKLHSDLPETTVWGYQGVYPGPTFEARTGVPITVTWKSSLPAKHLLPVDRTLPDFVHYEETHGVPLPDVRTVTHRHGGLQDGESDGGPDDWFTPGETMVGDGFTTSTYTYPDHQPAATLWYHDHAAGVTRINVYAGLAGFFLLRDAVEDGLGLPKGKYEVPIAIQDRTFRADGSLYYPGWDGDVFGDTAVVNGKVFPYLEVEPRKYRFRFLNGCNSRKVILRLSSGQPFIQIGTDTGLMAAPNRTVELSIAPGERVDVVVDFAGRSGQDIVLKNLDRESPLLPELMQFRVRGGPVADGSVVPKKLRDLDAYDEAASVKTRTLTLEHGKHGGKEVFLLDGKERHEAATEIARAGTIEVWEFVNLTGETHPMHPHMSDFQVIERLGLRDKDYMAALMAFREGKGPEPVLADYLTGVVEPAKKAERGPKDTVQAKGESVTRIAVKFGPDTGESVWHCHILEHEDNDMMRPLIVQ